MKPNYRTLEQTLGYKFKRKSHLALALTHPSFRYEKSAADDNQRLEYLGDAVLGLITADHLFKKHPMAREGELSKIRSLLTEDRKLAEIGLKADIGSYLELGCGEEKNNGASRPSNIADAVEAILGAAWVDGGTKAVHKIFNKIFIPELETLQIQNDDSNPKGHLQEYAQRNGLDIPTYTNTKIEGPEHDRSFTMEVLIAGKRWNASASSKREAERMAAAKALEELMKNEPQTTADDNA